jgi:23S rRNA pseudouridine2604 synthase
MTHEVSVSARARYTLVYMTSKKKESVPARVADEQSEMPMRLNKYLAHQGVATRRDADVLIEKGRVLVNGKRAVVGMKVSEGDTVEVLQKSGAAKKLYYVAYNKPRGVITHSAKDGEEDIISVLPFEFRTLGLYPVGRLDKDSYGLIVLTNDGRITDRLLRPDAEHEKEYSVRTKLPLRPSFKLHMETGVDIEGYMTKPAKMRVTGENTFSITLTEGKKHQIRRMVVAMHNEVTDLKRTRVMNIKLGNLKSGQARHIQGDELTDFLESLNLPVH